MTDDRLLAEFVDAFGRLDDMRFFPSKSENQTLPAELDGGHDDSPWANQIWKPAAIATDRSALAAVYETIEARFPPLYERLVLSYRWLDVQLPETAVLFANPPGPELTILASKITSDPILAKVLLPLGFVPFARASGGSYDPICFDTDRRLPDGDCPIVRIEHELVLCHERVGQVRPVADSFRALVVAVVATP